MGAMSEIAIEHEFLLSQLRRENVHAYVTVTSVARSGMSRTISAFVTTEDGHPIYLDSLLVSLRLGTHVDGKGVRVSGCGMDMVWWTMQQLSDFLGRKIPYTIVF